MRNLYEAHYHLYHLSFNFPLRPYPVVLRLPRPPVVKDAVLDLTGVELFDWEEWEFFTWKEHLGPRASLPLRRRAQSGSRIGPGTSWTARWSPCPCSRQSPDLGHGGSARSRSIRRWFKDCIGACLLFLFECLKESSHSHTMHGFQFFLFTFSIFL